MDVTKLIALLSSRCLFFVRADKLTDPWEGSISRANVVIRNALPLPNEERHAVISHLSRFRSVIRSHTYLSCWHENEYESDAMWKLYLKSDEGISVQTTFDRLIRSLAEYRDNSVYIGEVRYINYETEPIREDNSFGPYVYKRISFAHEKEVRAVIQSIPTPEGKLNLDVSPIAQLGLNVPVDLDTLIQDVYVAPTTPGWMQDAIQSLLGRYGLARVVCRSSLRDDPAF